jgi:uncharacterized lipoprotein YmbA
MKPIRTLILMTAAAGLLAGCSDMKVKVSNYPDDFVYLSRTKVTGTMGVLSAQVQRINDALKNDVVLDDASHQQIISALENMEAATYKLGAGTAPTNHLLIDKHIDRFKSDVQAALKAAKGSPPNYYLAGQVSGSCMACHIYR